MAVCMMAAQRTLPSLRSPSTPLSSLSLFIPSKEEYTSLLSHLFVDLATQGERVGAQSRFEWDSTLLNSSLHCHRIIGLRTFCDLIDSL